ncbi:endonuclease [Chryseobacterium gallinarum]|uniref:T9SS type A sorting domain-containing protein n=1 Tax=Chryseobacterium gallinarum TaxID=1324352 RepID=A0ABX6KQZ0_CHRGL|nr:endonuclease [Chryseobacterium gallinarum]QIY91042.1 T9SS type A sorting domain-containing protein [Chryseobacterium gallinarum]
MKQKLLPFLLIFTCICAWAQVPAGYYSAANGLTGPALKTALKNIIQQGHQDKGYNGLWTAYATTDRDFFYDNDGKILDIYSENPAGPDPYSYNLGTSQCGTYSSEGDCYNREHIVPQSLFNEASPMVADVHFIRATDGKVNGMRSNYPFGKVATASFTSQNQSKLGNSASPGYSGIVFEPIDEFKGDVARMIFYFVTRYEAELPTFSTGNMLGGSAFPGLQIWELNQLLEWNAMDPVSPAETARNDASYIYQGNRNPFIDDASYANLIWSNLPVDTTPPTAPTNVTASNPASNSMTVSWTAATDNVGVTSYQVYANGVLKSTVSGATTSTSVTGLSPLTSYSFYVIARDASGNASPQSNIATGTTLDGPAGNCGTEDFNSITGTDNSYATRTWTNNNIDWISTNTKIDEKINNSRAITIRNGELTSSAISGGIQTLTLTTQRRFSGSNGNLNVLVNGNIVGTIPYSETETTTTINVNISGNVVIKIVNPSSNRPTMDDLSWTCFSSSLATSDIKKEQSVLTIYPNPVKNNELFIKGENLTKISKAEIYDLSGRLMESLANPFKNSNKINLKGLAKGTYLLKTENGSTKFIVE